MENNWIKPQEYWLQKIFELSRIPRKLFGEGDKTHYEIENEKLWSKLRRK